MINIIFIEADHCEDCRRVSDDLRMISAKTTCKILRFAYNSQAGVRIGINHGISTLPAVVFNAGEAVLEGPDITMTQLMEAVEQCKKESKNL